MISLILPYWDRKDATERSLLRMAALYQFLDIEVIVVDDGSPKPFTFKDRLPFELKIIRLPTKNIPLNPCVPFNRGVDAAKGKYIAISNPEILHRYPVLQELSEAADAGGIDAYVTAACWCPEQERWHAHSTVRRSDSNDVGSYLPIVPRFTSSMVTSPDEQIDDMRLRKQEAGRPENVSILPCKIDEGIQENTSFDGRTKEKRQLPQLCSGVSEARETDSATLSALRRYDEPNASPELRQAIANRMALPSLSSGATFQAQYHFLSLMRRELWDKVGGFDEDYRQGHGYDDPDFVLRLHRSGARFIMRDDLVVEHPRKGARAKWDATGFERNRAIFMSKWALPKAA